MKLPVPEHRQAHERMITENPREAITYFAPMSDREADRIPLRLDLIRRVFQYTHPYASRRNWLYILTALRGLQLPCLAWMIGATINGPIARHDLKGIYLCTISFVLLAIFTAITFHFRQRFALELGEAVVRDMRSDLFRKLTAQPLSFFQKTKFGRIISRMTSDIDSIRVGVQDVAFVSVVQGLQMAGAGVLMAWYNVKLFILLLWLFPVVWVVNRRYHQAMSYRLRQVQETWSRLTSTLAESVGGVRVTQAFVRQEINAGFFRKLVGVHSENNLGVARASAVFIPLLQMKSQLFLGLVALLSGFGTLHWRGWLQMEAGDLVMFFFLINLFFDPIQVIGNQYNQALSAMAGAERLFRLLDQAPEWQDAPSARALPSLNGHVVFDQVDFAYQPGRPVLQGISFEAQPGETIALVGHTGSGKTTVVNLLQKFMLPSRGHIYLDGHDLLTITSQSLHARMGSVQQNSLLFSGSILDNIRFARPEVTENDVRAALTELDCLDLVEALPQGLHTLVGEKNTILSLGQRQLICFARAWVAQPRILVLDEATSAVDAMTEARIQRALNLLLRERTAFVVAHRLSTIRRADLVLVLDHGRIVERGTHDQLLAQNGVYLGLYREFVRSDVDELSLSRSRA
jgi:ATP-binding cassette, subfamily B, bacterial